VIRSSFVVLLEFLTKVALAGHQSAGYVFKTQLLKITPRGHSLAQGFKDHFGLEFRTEFSSAFFHSDSNLLVFLQLNLLSYFWGLFHTFRIRINKINKLIH